MRDDGGDVGADEEEAACAPEEELMEMGNGDRGDGQIADKRPPGGYDGTDAQQAAFPGSAANTIVGKEAEHDIEQVEGADARNSRESLLGNTFMDDFLQVDVKPHYGTHDAYDIGRHAGLGWPFE